MTDFAKAREMWAAMDSNARKKMLKAIGADELLHDHDWAGLPPQHHTVIIAGMPVEAAAQRDARRKKDDE